MEQAWAKILSYAVHYPSPHNSQPIKVRVEGDTLRIYYDLDLGLPAESFGIAFGSVCAGVFVESVVIAAHSLDFHVTEDLNRREMDFAGAERLHFIGTITLRKATKITSDLDPALMLQRRTSRLPYQPHPVPQGIMRELKDEAAKAGYRLHDTIVPELVHDIIMVNQRTLFYDLANPHVRHEIQGYLRYSRGEAKRRADGLSAECMDLPGPLMKLFMGNYWIWNIPLIGSLIRDVYLNSMKGVAHVAWLVGPFENVTDYTRAGRVFFRIWLRLTAHQYYLHPFGSVITNQRAHQEFVTLAKVDEKQGMAWMLFRLGASAPPPLAYRRTIESMRLPNA